MNESQFNVALVGASGAVGRVLLEILEQRKFPINQLKLFSSERSAGKTLTFQGKSLVFQTLQPNCFQNVDFAFFDVSDVVSEQWVPQAAKAGALVIDNSSVFRLDPEISLIVPEVNGDSISNSNLNDKKAHWKKRVFTGPNCVVAPLVMILKPLQERWGLRRIVVSTYQSTSGAGHLAMQELVQQTQAVIQHQTYQPKIFPHPIAFQCLPHIGKFYLTQDNDPEHGMTSEEQKIVHETRKILCEPSLAIAAMAVRVPTLSCHGQSVNIELKNPWSALKEIHEVFQKSSGVFLQDDPKNNQYPMGFLATGQDPVFVGRIRRDTTVDSGLHLWLMSDNLRKGAALNAVQIAEKILSSLQ